MSHNTQAKIAVSPLLILLLAFFVVLSSPVLLAALLLSALCHEMGHYVAIRHFGGRVSRITLSLMGADMHIDGRFSYGAEIITAAAGPLTNMALSFLSAFAAEWWEPLYLFAGCQMILGLFNLLPVLPLDGGRILWHSVAYYSEPFTADRVMAATGILFAVVLLLIMLILLQRFGGTPLLLLAPLGLLGGVIKENRLVKRPKKR